MIFGVGTDIVNKSRIADMLDSHGDKFTKRILVDSEIALMNEKYKNSKAEFLAKRFAAKEAIAKALGTGIGEQISFQDIEVIREESGKPSAHVRKFENLRIHLSISDEKDGNTIAFAIAER